jgi:lipid-A-disaccharide synthase-like uncharacterized protein
MQRMRSRLSGRIVDPRLWAMTFFGSSIAASYALIDPGGLTLASRAIGVAIMAAGVFLVGLLALRPWRDSQKNLRRVSVALPTVGILIVAIAALVSR